MANNEGTSGHRRGPPPPLDRGAPKLLGGPTPLEGGAPVRLEGGPLPGNDGRRSERGSPPKWDGGGRESRSATGGAATRGVDLTARFI